MNKQLKAVITVKGKTVCIIGDQRTGALYRKTFDKDLMSVLASYQGIEFHHTRKNELEIKRMMWTFLKRSNVFTPKFEKWEKQFTAAETYKMFGEASNGFLEASMKEGNK